MQPVLPSLRVSCFFLTEFCFVEIQSSSYVFVPAFICGRAETAGGPDGTFNAPPSSEQPEIVETDETVEVEQPAAEGGEEELKEEDPEIPVPPSLDLDAEILAARGGKGPVARPRPEDID